MIIYLSKNRHFIGNKISYSDQLNIDLLKITENNQDNELIETTLKLIEFI